MADPVTEPNLLKVLILEDQEPDAELMVHELHKAGFQISWKRADTEEEFEEALDFGSFDVILSDYSLPSFNAGRALELYQERKLHIPFIVVTGSLGEEQAVELMKMGASDYLIKDRLARLGGAVSAALAQKRLRDENRESLLRLRSSEEQLRRITENAPDAIYRYRLYPNAGYDYLSPAIKKLVGYTPDEFYEDSTLMLRIVHPDDQVALQRQFDAEKTIVEPYILRWIRKDGATVWTEQLNVPVYDEDGRLVAVEGIARDITERVLREREREVIISVVSALRDSMTRVEIIPVVLEKAAVLVKADGAAFSTCCRPGITAMVEVGFGVWKDWQGVELEIGEDVYRQVVGSRSVFDQDDVQDNPPGLPAAWMKGLHRITCIPLIAQGEITALLWLGCRKEMLEYERQEQNIKILTAIADIAASSLHRARLFEETQQRVQHLTALRTIDRAITASLDLNLTLTVLLEQLMIQKDVDAADVLLVDQYTRQLNYAGGRGFRGRLMEGTQQRLGESLAGQAVLDRRVLHLSDLAAHPQAFSQRNALLLEGFHAYLGIPLIAKGEVLGVLEVLRRQPGEFDVDWLEFVEALANQVAIAIHNGELFEKLQRTTYDIIQAYDSTIEGWARAMETREIETRGHTDRVVWWTTNLARSVGVPDRELVHLRRGALLHDIGKLALPDSILLKPGPLTGEEWMLVQKHPTYAFEWLSPIIYLHPALDIPYCHHEAWDGSGYPRGLKGAQIPIAARVFALVDAWDALRSDRPFRKAWPREKALQYIQEMSGVRYDPQVVSAFLHRVREAPVDDEMFL